MAETLQRLLSLEARIAELQHKLQHEQHRSLAREEAAAAQWDGLQQLLLAMFRQPQASPTPWEQDSNELPPHTSQTAAGPTRVNAANTLR